MRFSLTQSRAALLSTCIFSLLSVLLAGAAFAANCNKNPNHPGCASDGGGSGGGDGGGSDGGAFEPGRPAILFSAVTSGAGNGIWGMDEGSMPVLVVAAPKGVAHSWPVWSPDGKRFVYASRGVARPGLYLYDAQAKTSSFLAEGHMISSPSWSPDGEWIAYSARQRGHTDFGPLDLWFVRSDGEGAAVDLPTTDWWENGVAWSRDGRLAVTRFAQVGDDTDLNIFNMYDVVLDPDTGKVLLGDEEKIEEASAGAHFGLTSTYMYSPNWTVSGDRLLVAGRYLIVMNRLGTMWTCDYARTASAVTYNYSVPSNCALRQQVLGFVETAWSCPRTGSERDAYIVYAFPQGHTKVKPDLHEIASDLLSPPVPWQIGKQARHPSWWCPDLSM